MCPKQQQNANWSQVEIEILIVKGRNLPRTNSTKSETQIIFAKKQQNEHTPVQMYTRRVKNRSVEWLWLILSSGIKQITIMNI